MANETPVFKNLSLGAVAAITDSPPTIPAVYLFKYNKFIVEYNNKHKFLFIYLPYCFNQNRYKLLVFNIN